jgi:2,3-diketo-5-methylthio-1-phosphopentane phosphatase
MHLPIQILVDFDGTISCEDTTDLILERFAEPSWRAVEEIWERGEIGSRECMVRQIDLLRASPAELDSFLHGIPLDSGFRGFAQSCASRGLLVTVVSDGLDRSVKAALSRLELDLPVLANHLEWLGGSRWRLSFPHGREDCRSLAGNCKCRAQAGDSSLRVLIGDGRSDFCAAAEADMVFAKGRLIAHCRDSSIQHEAFTSFADLQLLFDRWLATRATAHANFLLPSSKDMIHAD